MVKNKYHGRTAVVLFLLFPLLLALSSIGGAPPHPAWGSQPSLKAVLSADNITVELSWEPWTLATAYRVFRAPFSQGPEPYQFSLLAELPAGQTVFTDDPGDSGSVVYRVVAVGGGGFDYGLAARIKLPAFGGLVPISMEFHPNTVKTALRSLESWDTVKDANSGRQLSGSENLHAGMVLKVDGFQGKTLTLVGTMPKTARFTFHANRYRLFAVPLTYEKRGIEQWRGIGLKGSESHSFVCSDGNNLQLPHEIPLMPGQVYGMRIDRNTEIDFISTRISQDSEVIHREKGAEELLGGSPDDGTQVVVLYDASYETKLYKCWNNGKSGGWDGVTDNAAGADNVKNAAVVRRGRTMYVKDEAGMSDTTPVTVLAPSAPGTSRQTVSWSVSWDSGKGAAAVQIPATAPVGDYQVRVGTDPGNYVTVYVIFDPGFATALLDANEYRSWAYVDDDWQTVPDLKNYLNYVFEGPGYPLGSLNYVYGYRGDSSAESGADGGTFGQRWVEMAVSIHGTGATTPLEAAVHAYQVIGQRITWVSGNGWYGNDGGEYNTFDDTLIGDIKAPLGGGTATELDVSTAEKAALGLGWSNRLPSNYRLGAGACFNFGTCLSAMIRTMGIPSRCQHSIGGDGWTSSFHAWAEALLENPEIRPLDPNWWDSWWYEVDCNDYYTGHSTSHSEGSISPLVISGYGDYLINEYIQCDGIGYDGSFFDNSFKCTPPGSNTGTHTVVPLQVGTTNDAEDGDSLPLVISYQNSSNAWALMNIFVPWNGPARPSGDQYVYDGHHGYALNDTQTGANGGSGYIDNTTNEDDLPILVDGLEQRGLIAGWGFMMYRIPVNGRPTITVSLVEGADKVEILATLDRNIYSTDRRWDLDYDFISDSGGVLTANTSGGNQLYLWVQMNSLSHSNPGNGQEVAWYTIRAGDSSPYVNAKFSYSKTGDYDFQFTDESIVYNDTIDSWSWDFGDGNTSTQQNPTHTYASSGYFDVSLTVTGTSGTNDTETIQIWVGPNQAPTADFSYTVLGGNVVAFADQSTDIDGTVQGWSWNFGDGNTSTDQNPTHQYASPGTYSVTLTVTDDDGATDDVTRSVSVILQYCASSSSSDTMSIIQVDIGSFTNTSGKSTYTDFSSLIINMDTGESYSVMVDLDDNFWTAYTRIWIDYNRDGDYEDANELVFQDAHSGANNGTITVPSSGVVTGQTLGMRIHTDTMNYKEPCDTNSGWGEVEDYTVIIGGSGGNLPPNAGFTFNTSGLSVNFTDQSTDSDGVIQSWSWNFGDGNTSTQQNPSHTYASAGTYNVTLTVTDNGGAQDATAADVTVNDPTGNQAPTADFTYSTDGLVAIFTSTASDPDGTIQTWSWDFGDGTSSDAVAVGHTYTAGGTYLVTLTVTDDDGASDATSVNVSVSGFNTVPEAEFSYSVSGLVVDFTDLSRDPDPDDSIQSWAWNFGDGNTATQQNPSHTYSTAGTFDVTLTVTDGDSNTDPVTHSVTVTAANLPPTADFTFSTGDLTANFTDASSDSDGSVTGWSWNFGDGNTTTQQNPSHTYASGGTYTVTLTITDNDGATDNTSQAVTVNSGGGGEVPDYCPSYSASDSMSIVKVEFGTFTNTSGKSTYTDFTDQTINLQPGQTYLVKITVDDNFWSARTRIWIDFNRDGDFFDAGEKVFQKSSKGTISANVTIPSSGVVTGQKLGLRIHTDTMNYKGPCSTNSGWGEVEDYAVIIQ
jgi:PKD repeat protein